MAGTPKKREAKLANALRANGIDPEELIATAPGASARARVVPGLEPLDGPPTRARAHARARDGTSPRVNPIGPEVRKAMDSRAADDIEALSTLLAPGLTVRLERVRPLFAAGYVGEVPIDGDSVGELLDWIKHEHGGQLYKATVCAADGSIVYVARIPIAGPPRRMGRVLSRAAWDGLDDDDATPARAANPAPAAPATPQRSSMSEMLELFGELRAMSESRQEATLGAVREMITTHQTQTQGLLTAIFERIDPERNAGGFRARIQELADAANALEEIREVIGVGPHAAPAPEGAPERSGMSAALERAASEIIVQGFKNDQERAARRRAGPPPAAQTGAPRAANFRRVGPRRTPGQGGAPPQGSQP
jgi:hypothetical protein